MKKPTFRLPVATRIGRKGDCVSPLASPSETNPPLNSRMRRAEKIRGRVEKKKMGEKKMREKAAREARKGGVMVGK
ncbi:hypothetical protein BOTNAR_0056g00270 [Botryotinia narcissicola]|uniref:Uncharacterized protein n=1 Tax=Botryotinia narcissicola TaxID=278944 RepID=A0A4Z1IZ38_9HELO|nr:hypothetical protein BOTNAR_0056g00270 [Botryotinia narcissicola]